MNVDDLEAVPLSPEEKSDIAEAWLAYIHALPDGAEPDLRTSGGGSIFKTTVNRILLAHGFEPFSATLAWTADREAILMARKLPTTTSS